jgi:hypothetical protein
MAADYGGGGSGGGSQGQGGGGGPARTNTLGAAVPARDADPPHMQLEASPHARARDRAGTQSTHAQQPANAAAD